MRAVQLLLVVASAWAAVNAAALSITTEASVKTGAAIRFQWSGGTSPYSLKIFVDDSVVASNDGWQSRSVQWRASGDNQVPIGSKIKIRVTDAKGETVVSDETTVVDKTGQSPPKNVRPRPQDDGEKPPSKVDEDYDDYRGEGDRNDHADDPHYQGTDDDDYDGDEVTPNDGSKEMMSDPLGGGGGREVTGRPAPTPTRGSQEDVVDGDGIMSIQTVPNPGQAVETVGTHSIAGMLTDSEPTATAVSVGSDLGASATDGTVAPTSGAANPAASSEGVGNSAVLSSSTLTSSLDEASATTTTTPSSSSFSSSSTSSSSSSSSSSDTGNTMTYVIVGVVLLVVILASALGGIYWWKKRQARRAATETSKSTRKNKKARGGDEDTDDDNQDEERLVGSRDDAQGTRTRRGGGGGGDAYDSDEGLQDYRDDDSDYGDGLEYTDSDGPSERPKTSSRSSVKSGKK